MGALAVADDFLDVVYEAAVDEVRWRDVLDRLCDHLGGDMIALRKEDAVKRTSNEIIGRLDTAMIDPYVSYYQYRNPASSPAAMARASLIDRDIDRVPRAEFLKSEFYNDFLKVFDLHADLAIGLCKLGQTKITVNVLRSPKRGEWTLEDVRRCAAVYPHLARAMRLGQRVGALRGLGEGLSEVIERSRYGLVLLDRDGCVRHMNRAAERSLARGGRLSVFQGRLTAARRDDERRLRELIGRAALSDGEGRTGGSMAVSGEDGGLELSVMVAPLAADRASPIIDGPAVVVCVTDHKAGVTVPEQRLHDLFSLTASEAKVAVCLLEGLSPNEAAARLSIGIATVRFHLSRILEKTGARGQVELSHLMMKTIGMGVS